MKILSSSDNDLRRAARAIAEGKLVALPTETVYGLAADAGNRRAVAAVFAAKERPSFDPLIVHVPSVEEARKVADFSVPYAEALARRFWPGPLTLVLPKQDWVPGLITSDLPSVAVRCPAHELTRRVIEYAGVPVAAPSANPFGRISPTTAEHVAAGLGERIDYILDGGECRLGVESTVLDLSGDDPMVLRPGGLSVESLQECIPDLQLFDRSTSSPKAPGQLPSHYAPRKDLYLYRQGGLPAAIRASAKQRAVSALCFGKEEASSLIDEGLCVEVLDLSPEQDPVQAAANLFAHLHRLEADSSRRILAARLPEQGLGRAVNDRLYKASVNKGEA